MAEGGGGQQAPAAAQGEDDGASTLRVQRSSIESVANQNAKATGFRVPQNPVVALLFHVSEHRYTDQFILFCIFVNSCTLALDDPRKVRTILYRLSSHLA